MESRRRRLAKLKKGPGVFIYDGSHKDHEWKPTPKLTGKKEIVCDNDGIPVLDDSGRPTYKPAGKVVFGDDGKPLMGGKPKVIHTKVETRVIRGVTFVSGEATVIDDASLALKLRGMEGFKEVAGEAISVETDTDKALEDMNKAELAAKAAELGVEVPGGSSKADIKKLIEEAQAE